MRYFNHAKSAELDRAAEFLCQADQTHKDLLEASGDIPILPLRRPELLPSWSQRTTCEVKTVQIQLDKAFVTAEVSHPDLDSWFEHASSSAIIVLLHAHNGIQAAQKVVTEALAATPLEREERTFDLVKEKNGWHVNLHLSDSAKLDEICSKASEAASQGNFDEAEIGFQEAMKLHPHYPRIPKALADIKSSRAAVEAASSYIPNVKILSTRSEREEDAESEVKVEVHLKNAGDKPIRKVGVAYQLFDQRGKVIEERVDFQEFSPESPLKPGAEGDASYTFKQVPQAWKGQAKARVRFLETSSGEEVNHIPFVEIMATHYTEILSELVTRVQPKAP